MNRAELEKKHLAELHTLAAEAGVERYRMLPRAELIDALADGGSGNGSAASSGSSRRSTSGPGSDRGGAKDSDEGGAERRPRRRRRSSGSRRDGSAEGAEAPSEQTERPAERTERPRPPARESVPEPSSVPAPAVAEETPSRPRRRRRRRFGRRGKQGVTLQGLLLPPESGRQALLAAETREACTDLLRGIAAELSDEKGPDPVALLVDPSPEELADWRRDAPKAEIVAAGQPRHASDALAQAIARAAGGDHVFLLVDSLTRLGEAYGDPEAAKEFFDAGRTAGGSGSLTVVAAIERPTTG